MSSAGLAALTFAGVLAVSGAAARAWQQRSRAAQRLHSRPDDADSPEPVAGSLAGQRSIQVGLLVGAGAGAIAVVALAQVVVGLGLGAVVGALAFIAHRARVDRAALALEEGLADALDLVTSALRSGASPLDAFQRAARDAREPLRRLLSDMTGRLATGENPSEATARLTQEVPLESFRLLALCLAIQWHAGGQLSRSLAVVSRSVRDRADVLRRIESQAAPTRGSVLVLMAANLAIAVVVWLNDPPGIASFLASGVGEGLVGGTLLVQALSLLWMWRISRITV